MAVPTTLVIDATQETLEITNSRDATALRGISIEVGPPTDGEGLFYQASTSEYVFRTVDESIDDRVAALLQDSSSGGLSWSYNDSAGTLTPVLALVNADIASGAAIAVSKLASSSVSYGGVSVTLGAADATPAFNLSDATAYPGDSSLVTTGALNSGSITSGFGNIDVGSSSIDGGTITADTAFVGNLTGNASGTAATVTGATQAAITSAANLVTVGTIGTGVWQGTAVADAYVANDLTISGGTVNNSVIGGSTAAAITGTTLKADTSLELATGATVTGIDNGDLATGSATLLATQGAIKTYIDSSVTAQDLDVITDSGTIDIDLDSESLTLTGGTGIDTSATGTTVTYAIDSTVATLAGSQTLTNKTISGSSNTLSNIANGSLTNSTVSYGGISLSLGGSDATPAFDLADATNYGAGDLAGSTLASGVTASSLTSVGTLTELQVDNININLNTISSTAGTDLNITPLSGQQIVLDGTIVIDAGVVTGATSITSTAFVGNVTGDCSGSSGSTTGNAATATLASTVTVADSSDTTAFPAFFDSATGSLAIMTDASNLTYNASTGVLTATGFAGPLTGNVTGDCSGSSGSTTGNAATATALATARTIGGTSFDGTANIVPGTITVAATTDETCSVALFESATGDLAPKTDAGLTYNANSNVLAGTFSGDITGDVTGNVSGSAASLSATLAVASGGTNITSYTAGDILYASGSTTLAKLAKGSDTEVLTLASGVPSWSAPGAAAAGSLTGTTLASNVVTSSLTSTGALNAGSITSGFGAIDVGSSNIDGGTITADTALVGTLSTAAQTNITSLGTLTSLGVGAITSTGNFTTTGTGPHAVGIASADYIQWVQGGAFTSGGATTRAGGLVCRTVLTGAVGDTTTLATMGAGNVWGSQIITQGTDTNISVVATMYLSDPDITNNLASSGKPDYATTLYVKDAPTEGDENYAILSHTGNVKFAVADLMIDATKKIYLDGGGNTYIYESSGDVMQLVSGGVDALRVNAASVVVNEGSADFDFRVESNGNANMLFVDGGNDKIGIGTATPDYRLHTVGSMMIEDSSPRLYMETTSSSHINWKVSCQDSVSNTFEIMSGGTDADLTNDTWTNRFAVNTGGIHVPATNKIYLDGGSNTYIIEPSADRIELVAGNNTAAKFGVGTANSLGGGTSGWAGLKVATTFTSDGSDSVAHGAYFGGAVTGAAGDTGYMSGVFFDNQIITQTATESIGLISQVRIAEPNITDNLTGDITTACSLYVHAAPTEGESNYALYVKAGLSRFDGKAHVFSGSAGSTADSSMDELVLENGGDCGMSILSNTGSSIVAFGDTEDSSVGQINYIHSSNVFRFTAGGISHFWMASDGFYLGALNGDNQFRDDSAGSGSTTMYIGNQAITTSSDRRLKTNIVDSSLNAVEALNQLRVTDFNWDDPSDQSFNNRNARGVWTGMIAQEVVDHLPFTVNAPRDEDKVIDYDSDSTWSIEPMAMCGVLVKAVQELSTRIEALEAQLDG